MDPVMTDQSIKVILPNLNEPSVNEPSVNEPSVNEPSVNEGREEKLKEKFNDLYKYHSFQCLKLLENNEVIDKRNAM